MAFQGTRTIWMGGDVSWVIELTCNLSSFLIAPLEVCLERCLKRGAGGSGRSDDNPDSLKKRFNTYLTETKPIIDHYAKSDLVRQIDATRSEEEVYGEVQRIFDEVATPTVASSGDN